MNHQHLIYAPDAVRNIDRAAMQQHGIAGYTLMNRAGRRLFNSARGRYPSARRWLILCGAGNNGGDGYVLARLARAAGLDVTVAALAETNGLRGSAEQACNDFRAGGGEAEEFQAGQIDAAELVVDAMFGTGLTRPVEGRYLEAIEAVNASGKPVIAVDVPSGLNAETGAVLGAAIRASMTVTFVGLKTGLYLADGPDHVGDLRFADLDVPETAATRPQPRMRLVHAGMLDDLLPPRPPTAHKGMFGHVLVIGGNHGMGGAARLAGEAALRAGAGLVTVATRPGNTVAVVTGCPALMCTAVNEPGELDPLLERASVIALGPGLGLDDWARGLFARLVGAPQPMVLDADALALLAREPRERVDWVLTPHPGEAGRMLERDTGAVQADRLGAIEALGEHYGGVAVLKGCRTLIGMTGTQPFVVDRGNPGMASAGMGDVLTGVIAGLFAQAPGYIHRAAAVGAWVHALAGDRAAAHGGMRGLTALDVLAQIRPCLNQAD